MNRLLLFLLSLVVAGPSAWADTFGTDPNQTFQIEFVPIGDPGNAADTSGFPNQAGSVPYLYRIGKFEISEQMIDRANAQSAADGQPLGLTHDNRGADKPATSISWFEAAEFVNWLNTSTDSTPAYKFDGGGNFQLWQPGDLGFNSNNLFRNTLAQYVLPDVDEWYKAAYYDPNTGAWNQFPTGSLGSPVAVTSGTAPGTAVFLQSLATGPADITQAGGLSPYGTMAQGGNVTEWHETEVDLFNDDPLSRRILRGGSWDSTRSALSVTALGSNVPYVGNSLLGFRVASLLEPLILALVDIKPGSLPNSVNLKSRGVLPIAILSTDDFDVHDVDIDTLLFGDPLLVDNGGTAVSPLRSALEDVSGDGLLDLTLKFSTADLVEHEALGPDTIEGLLTGELLDGTPFEGADSIRIVPPTNTGRSPLVLASVPEPSSIGLLGLGLMLPLVLTRRIHSLRAGPFSSH